MSENSKKTVCPQCGAEVTVNESKDLRQICNILRGLMEDEELDTEEIVTEELEVVEETLQDVSISVSENKKPRDKIKSFVSNQLINRICVLFLAIAMLALAFSPFVSYNVVGEDNKTYTIGFSGADMIRVLVGSATYSDVSDSYYDHSLNADDENKNSNISIKDELKKETLLSIERSGVGIKFTVVIAVLAYIVHFIFCVILFVLATKNLISEFFVSRRNRKRVKKYGSDTMPCVILCFIPFTLFCILQACRLCTGYGVLNGVAFGADIALGALLSVALAFVGTVFVCIARSVGTLSSNKRYFDRLRVKHIICVFLTLVILLSTLLPFMQVKNSEAGAKVSMSVTQWDIREMTRTDREKYYKQYYTNEDKDELIETEPSNDENESVEFVNGVLLGSNIPTIRVLYFVMELATSLTLLFGGILLLILIKRAFFASRRRRAVNTFKVFTALAVSFSLIVAVVFNIVFQQCLPKATLLYVDLSLGVGIVLMFICMILLVCTRLRAKKDLVYIDEDYDNADVSYAPYVLDNMK